MHPILFTVGGLPVYSYGFFIAFGYLSGLLLGRWLAKHRGQNPGPLMDIAFLGMVSGILGARLFFLAQNVPFFVAHPAEIFNVRGGGLVFYGGFFLAAPVMFAYGYWKKLPLLRSCDIVVPCVALAHAFGRLGCLAAGCCYGSICPYPWAIRLPAELVGPELKGQPLHPTQLYESFGLFCIVGALAWCVRRGRMRDGTVSLLYIASYALLRFTVEFFRGDVDRGFVFGTSLSMSQAIAIPLFLGSGALLLRRIATKNL